MLNTLLSDTPCGTGRYTLSLDERYHLFEQVGFGGYSQVFRAWDCSMQREVAVKLLHDHLSAEQIDQGMYQMQHEAHLLTSLNHPAIPCLYEYNEHVPMLVLPFLDGFSLASLLQRSRRGLPLVDVMHVGKNLSYILAYLHQQQIVFCDLSANNIMISTEGNLFLIDFGIAYRMEEAPAHMLIGIGTPGFAAPELYPNPQYLISPASDIYSLGVVLHYACTGKDPTHMPSPFAFSCIPDHVPASLRALILAMLDPTPDKRPTLLEVRHILNIQCRMFAY